MRIKMAFIPVCSRLKNEKFRCNICGGLSYWKWHKTSSEIWYKYCPICGRRKGMTYDIDRVEAVMMLIKEEQEKNG